MGHTAVTVDATESWGEELLIIFGGLSEEKYALGDLRVLQARTVAWFHPEVPNSTSPPARAFHCGAAAGKKVYIFGGHVWVKQTRGLQKFDDFWCLDTVRSLGTKTVPSWMTVCQFISDKHESDVMPRRCLQDTWEWTVVDLPKDAPRPSARDFAGMVSLPGDRLLLFGGLDATEKRVDDTWLFDAEL